MVGPPGLAAHLPVQDSRKMIQITQEIQQQLACNGQQLRTIPRSWERGVSVALGSRVGCKKHGHRRLGTQHAPTAGGAAQGWMHPQSERPLCPELQSGCCLYTSGTKAGSGDHQSQGMLRLPALQLEARDAALLWAAEWGRVSHC